MKERKRLLLFTVSYPYDYAKEANFILPELPYLQSQYEEVILVPSIIKGVADPTEVHGHCQVNKELAYAFDRTSRAVWLFRWSFWKWYFQLCFQILSRAPLNISLYVNAVFFVIRMLVAKEFFKSIRDSQEVDGYTFWNTFVTAALAKEESWKGKRWTRVHGDDFYPERQGGLIFFEKQTYRNLDSVVFVSHLAQDYWRNRHPKLNTPTEVRYLGVKVPAQWKVSISLPTRIPLKVFSCSGLNPIKRIPLCHQLIRQWNKTHPAFPIAWHHLGANTEELNQWIGEESDAIGHGWMSQSAVLDWIRKENPFCLVSVSESEGFPVSMQESMLCGVPILAAANGGMVEAVAMCKGWSLPSNPDYSDFEMLILRLLELKDEEILEHRQFTLNVANAQFLR
jgi:glycosyltransferase involved in cell wall biosynthesis